MEEPAIADNVVWIRANFRAQSFLALLDIFVSSKLLSAKHVRGRSQGALDAGWSMTANLGTANRVCSMNEHAIGHAMVPARR
jgi:hypothetical protein